MTGSPGILRRIGTVMVISMVVIALLRHNFFPPDPTYNFCEIVEEEGDTRSLEEDFTASWVSAFHPVANPSFLLSLALKRSVFQGFDKASLTDYFEIVSPPPEC